MNESNLYSNIVLFLKKHGFKVSLVNPKKIIFLFDSEELSNVYQHFQDLRKKGDEAESEEESDSFYRESWKIRLEADKKYFPKLQIILDVLNDFYSGRPTPLEFRISFNNKYIETLYLGENSLYFEMYPDKEEFDLNIIKEFEYLDKFLDQI